MVVINDVNAANPVNMAGENEDILIPSVMVSMSDGSTIKQNIDTLASLSFDATKKEMLSSFLGRQSECNIVRSPSFLLQENSTISIWVNFGIRGITVNADLYDRANIGLFHVNGKDRVTITPDGGEKYNSNVAVNTIGSCPAPGDTGWRDETGPVFKEVVFSSKALQDANMTGEIVQLEIALATGLLSYASFFSIQKIVVEHVGILAEDDGRLCQMPSAAPQWTSTVNHSQAPYLKSSHEPSGTLRSDVPDTSISSHGVPNPFDASSSMQKNSTVAVAFVIIVAIFALLA